MSLIDNDKKGEFFMKKKYLFLCFSAILVLMVSMSLLAAPKILKKSEHKGKTCTFCHDQAKFPKKKGGYDKNGPNFKKIGQNKLCSEGECH